MKTEHPIDWRLKAISDRIDRAQENIDAIKAILFAYFDSDSYEFRGEYDLGATEFPIVGRAEMPTPRLATLAGEVLHDLRSALDHLAWEFVRANNGQPDGNTRFPILSVPPTANKQGIHPSPTVSGGVSPVAQAIVDAAQPYTVGSAYHGHPLWFLHRMNIVDKHRHVAIQGVYLTHMTFRTIDFAQSTWTAFPVEVSEYGAELIFDPDNPDVDMEAGATLQVVVDEPADGIEGRPLLRALEDALEAVREIDREARDKVFV